MRAGFTRVALVLATAALMSLSASPAISDDGATDVPGPGGGGVNAQSDIQTFTTIFRTDVAFAGLGGLRGGGTGSGTIALSGVTGVVSKAYLYWHGPTNSSDPAVNAAVTFAGQPVTGANIGTSSPNCWGFANSQAYRADVTSLVSGNGSFSVDNFRKAPDADINGIELVVFYNDADPTNDKDVVIFDGNDSNIPNSFDANGWNVVLPGINYTSGAASIEFIVGDGQSFPDDALVLNTQTLVATGAIFQGNTVPDAGTASNTSGGLWDQRNFNITSFLSPGPNTLTLTTGVNSDCLSLVVAAVILPAGSAPNQPPLVTIVKDVSGEVPSGTTFVVDMACMPVTGGPSVITKARFDDSGTPIGQNVLQATQGSTCVVAEEAVSAAGASVQYSCELAAALPADACSTNAGGATLTVGANASGSVATVTVINSYGLALLPAFTG